MRVVASHLQRRDRPRDHLVLTLQDEEGFRGTGDAAPLPPFSPDDTAAGARVLTRVHERLAPLDDDAPPAAAVAAALLPFGRDLDVVPSARFALETALFDLVSEHRSMLVVQCLGGSLDAGEVPLNALLFPDPLDTLADRVQEVVDIGFTAVKIKLRARDDTGFDRELDALRAVRERFPLPFEIRLDPNAAWPLDLARRRLAALAAVAPSYVEQPVSAADLPRLGEQAVPWAADESLLHPDLVEALVSSPHGCAAFVLKPALLGGLLATRALAMRAQDHGLGVVVTHLFDGPYALAASCELALSLPRPPLACGLALHDDFHVFAANFGDLDLNQLSTSQTIRPSLEPGLGVNVRPMGYAWERR